MSRMPQDGDYYATRTLLACEPGGDRNARYVYCWPDDSPWAIMNSRMRKWTEKDEANLQIILEALNLKTKAALASLGLTGVINVPGLAEAQSGGKEAIVHVSAEGDASLLMTADRFDLNSAGYPGAYILSPMVKNSQGDGSVDPSKGEQ